MTEVPVLLVDAAEVEQLPKAEEVQPEAPPSRPDEFSAVFLGGGGGGGGGGANLMWQ